MSLVANQLETNGIATVIIGSARDIVEYCGVPRFLFVDFPLGNPAGVPWDQDMQLRITTAALKLLQSATQPGTTAVSNEQWPGDQDWRWRYNYVGEENRETLRQIGEARRREQTANKSQTQ